MRIKAIQINGKWYVRLSWQGKRKFFRAGNSEEEAHKIASDFQVLVEVEGEEKALSRFGRKKKPRDTVKTYAEQYMRRLVTTDLKETTINRYQGDLLNHIIPHFGNIELCDITRPMLKDFLTKKVDSGLKRDTVRNIVAALSTMLTEAMDDGLIDANPALRLGKFYRRAKKNREEPDPFSREEARISLEGLRKKFPEYYEFFLCMYRTGVRPGEATVLKVTDLDFRHDSIMVERNLPSNPSIKKITTTKGKRKREVEMDSTLKQALQEMLKRRREEYMAKGQNKIPEWLFCHEATSMRDIKNWQNNYPKCWKRVLAAVEIRYRSPGHMRHTFASLNLSESKHLLWVSAQLGHKDPDVTLKKYAKWMPKEEGKKARLRRTREGK
ncbi:site-specific integrase [Acidobacteria bacterium AH-259-A15]|nr:site-specific integrase [Acidobacteria bacterium AH-259-A15]